MRVIFTGRDNSFNRKIVRDFSLEHNVVCCLFLESERLSWQGKFKVILRRIKKIGLIKAADQFAFHLFDRLFLRKAEPAFWKQQPEYCEASIPINCPIYYVDEINNEKWLKLCRELNPDIILATCSHVIFESQFYTIPALGTYVIHEGLTPEYKGLHTVLWALMKKEFQYIGYTAFKVNDKIDGGNIIAQGTYSLQEGEDYKVWSWIGHNAIISGLGNILQAFRELEKREYFVPVITGNRKIHRYTWIGLSDFLQLYFKNYRRPLFIHRSAKFKRAQQKLVETNDEKHFRLKIGSF